MFHLFWALRHTFHTSDYAGRLPNISRADLRGLPEAFANLVENLDPSAFWETVGGVALWEDSSVSFVHKLAQWNEFLDDYMRHHGMYIRNFTRRTMF